MGNHDTQGRLKVSSVLHFAYPSVQGFFSKFIPFMHLEKQFKQQKMTVLSRFMSTNSHKIAKR
jgi:hypothetical protein